MKHSVQSCVRCGGLLRFQERLENGRMKLLCPTCGVTEIRDAEGRPQLLGDAPKSSNLRG